jgi:hypothetical protein
MTPGNSVLLRFGATTALLLVLAGLGIQLVRLTNRVTMLEAQLAERPIAGSPIPVAPDPPDPIPPTRDPSPPPDGFFAGPREAAARACALSTLQRLRVSELSYMAEMDRFSADPAQLGMEVGGTCDGMLAIRIQLLARNGRPDGGFEGTVLVARGPGQGLVFTVGDEIPAGERTRLTADRMAVLLDDSGWWAR